MNTRHPAEVGFELQVSYGPRRTIVRLLGDCDAPHQHLLTQVLRASLTTSDTTELDLSGAGVFGSAAIAALVASRRGIEQPKLVISNPNTTTQKVLDVTALDVPIEQRAESDAARPISRATYNQLIARSVTSGREAMCITTDDLDAPGPRIVYVNPAFCELTGYDSNEMLGQSPRILQGALTDRSLLARLRKELETGQTFHGETVNYRKDGTPFYMNWKISAVDADDGRYFVAHQTDGTRSVLGSRNSSALALLRSLTIDAGDGDRGRRVAEVLAAAHNVLLGAGLAGCEIRTDAGVESAGEPLPEDDTVFDRARRLGPVIRETTFRGFELVLASQVGGVEVRSRIVDLTDDHLKLTELDDHAALIELAALLATAQPPG